VALRNSGNYAEAASAFQKALALQPDATDTKANLGITLLEMNQLEHAELCLREVATLMRTPIIYSSLATTLYLRGKRDESMDVYRQWLEIDPDHPIPRHMVAAGTSAIPERAADEYVATVFDSFAENFETTLLNLGYQTPQILADMLRSGLGTDASTPRRILDAGCGTGLAAPLLRPMASQLVGVDLSKGMLDKARARNLYDELAVGELCAFMSSRPGAFDVIFLADTLVYFGALEQAFDAAHSALAPGGILIFALEARPPEDGGPGYHLEVHGRYSHRPDYATGLLKASGYSVSKVESTVIRKEVHADVNGVAIMACRNTTRDEH
jgi:predicted TPR repeat methyltransferase